MVFVISFPFLLIILTCFSSKTEMVKFFLVFSPKQLNCFWNTSARSVTIKLQSQLDPTWKTIWISVGKLYLKLYMLFAAPLYFPVYGQFYNFFHS